MKLAAKLGRASAGILILLFAVVGLFAFAGTFAEYPVIGARPSERWIRGAYHVHSTRSHDGRGSEERIARAAAAAGLDFVVLTEHNLATRSPPRWSNGVLLIDATELSTRAGHLVALGVAPEQIPDGTPVERYAAIVAHGGFAVLAHPVQRKNPWRDDAVAAAAGGFELYSYDSLLRATLAHPISRLIPAVGAYLAENVHGLVQLAHDVPDARGRLLALSESKQPPPVALCAVDAHGLVPYEAQFRVLSMVAPITREQLGSDPERAAATVLDALRSARAFCSFGVLADPSGYGIGVSSRRVAPGERFIVTLPEPSPPGVHVRVFGAGTLEPDGRTVRAGERGALQVEVWVDAPGALFGDTARPWIVSSPFAVAPPPSK